MDSLLKKLDGFILSDGRTVAYRWLSDELGLSCDAAKQLLFVWVCRHQPKGGKTTDGPFAVPLLTNAKVTYQVSGSDENNNDHVLLCSAGRLTDAQARLKQVTSVHVYGVGPGSDDEPVGGSSRPANQSAGSVDNKADATDDGANDILIAPNTVSSLLWMPLADLQAACARQPRSSQSDSVFANRGAHVKCIRASRAALGTRRSADVQARQESREDRERAQRQAEAKAGAAPGRSNSSGGGRGSSKKANQQDGEEGPAITASLNKGKVAKVVKSEKDLASFFGAGSSSSNSSSKKKKESKQPTKGSKGATSAASKDKPAVGGLRGFIVSRQKSAASAGSEPTGSVAKDAFAAFKENLAKEKGDDGTDGTDEAETGGKDDAAGTLGDDAAAEATATKPKRKRLLRKKAAASRPVDSDVSVSDDDGVIAVDNVVPSPKKSKTALAKSKDDDWVAALDAVPVDDSDDDDDGGNDDDHDSAQESDRAISKKNTVDTPSKRKRKEKGASSSPGQKRAKKGSAKSAEPANQALSSAEVDIDDDSVSSAQGDDGAAGSNKQRTLDAFSSPAAKKTGAQRMKRKKTVTRAFMDDEGFMCTEDVEVTDDEAMEEGQVLIEAEQSRKGGAPSSKGSANKPTASPRRSPRRSPQKKAASAAAAQKKTGQASISSFFSKKGK